MSGLKETFDGQVEFIDLNWDDSSLNDTRRQLSITDRTQYILVDTTGTVVKRWYGILDEGAVTSDIEALLSS